MRYILFPILASAAMLSGCGGTESQPQAAASAPPVAVQAATVRMQEWPDVYEATGTVRARTTTVLASKVMAYVRQVGVQVGDRVHEGQLLVTLDAEDLDSRVRTAEAGEAEVMTAIPEADSGVAGAKANLDLAQSTFKRMEELASKRSISNQELDEASARLKSAQAAYEMARSKRAQLDSRRASVKQEILSATIMRDYTRISAPYSGVVTAKSVEPGNLAAPGVPLLTIEREGAYRLEASVDESRLPLVKAGQPVDVELESLKCRIAARVSEIVPAVDAGSRSYTVKIDLPASANLRSGTFGRAMFLLGSRKVETMPSAAVVEHGQLQSVFTIEDGRAHTRLITTGERRQTAIEVLSGLNDGEKLVNPVPAGLTDGTRVEIRE